MSDTQPPGDAEASLVEQLRVNLILEHHEDDVLLAELIAAATSFHQQYGL